MKLLSIRIKNINSLKGEHHVDFMASPLAEAGLFAITGPTGAGKSTLLDAITLALFNQIPRVAESQITKKVIQEQGLLLTHHTTDGYAEIDYEVKGKRYRSSWSIAYNRNNNLNERKHELAEIHENGEVANLIEDKISHVAAANESIIGLNYQQFIQSMVLAQGQFAKLLQANKADRSKLLEEITGAKIYRRIGQKTFQKYAFFKGELHNLSLQKKEIKCFTQEERKEKEQEITLLTPQIVLLKKELEELQKAINLKEQIQSATQKMATINADEQLHVTALKALQIELQRLRTHQRFAPFQQGYFNWKNLEKSLTNLKKEQAHNKEKLETLKEKQAKALQETGVFLKKAISIEHVERELAIFQDEVRDLVEKENAQLETSKQLNTRIEEEVNKLNKLELFHFERSQNSLQDLMNLLKLTNEEIASAGITSLAELKSKREESERKKLKFSNLISEKRLQERIENLLKSIRASISEVDQQQQVITRDLKAIEEEIITLQPQLKEATFKLEKHRQSMSLNDYRAKLVDGEPCPLCGSEEHPLASEFQESLIHELEKNHQLLTEKLDGLTTKKIKLESDAKNVKANVANYQTQLKNDQKELGELTEKISNLLADLAIDKQLTLNEILAKSDQEDALYQKLHTLADYFSAKALLQDLVKLQETYSEARHSYIEISEKRKSKYEGKDVVKDVANRKENLQKLNSSLVALKEQIEKKQDEITQVSVEIEQYEKATLPKLKEAGVETIHELETKFLDEESANEIRKKEQAIQQGYSQWKGKKETHEHQLKELKSQDKTPIELTELLKKKETHSADLEKKESDLRKNHVLLEEDDKLRLRHSALEKEEAQINKELEVWSVMNQLIGDSTGNKFSNFVQDLTLDQLIDYANIRLDGLSERYQLSKPTQENQKSLLVVDRHLGNTERAVTSLSGGETFKLSLALALGLSDLAAQNIQIESLFIDEGFGTLDPESLDAAISVLEEMQHQNNKSIGIISHVAELKERIGTKIKLVPTGGGYSKIEVE